MNAEHLLDAIGQLDDDLVREAERYRRPKARYGFWMGLAASFAVVIALGYVLTHFGMGGGASGGNGGAPASGNSMLPGGDSGAPNMGEDGNQGGAFASDVPPEAMPSAPGSENAEEPGSPQEAPRGTVYVHGDRSDNTYILTGEVLTELPEDGEPVLLGELLALEQDSPWRTTVEEYVGLNLWAENEDILYAVYVELPEGGFARAELVEP